MKKIILAIALLSISFAYAETPTKKVCETTKDAKTGKEKEVCKNIKIHKKLDGEKLPEKK